jgi:exodeoxyribonuclease VII large subunit
MTHNNELSLFQLNSMVRTAVKQCFPESIWVRAELAEARTSGPGHCYLELVEKDPVTGDIIARARGAVWANTWRRLKPFFEEQTGQEFTAGIKVLVEVSIDYHELYGFTLTVSDIDPSYTLGDMARQRAEILKRLEQDGVRDMNKEQILAPVPTRIAVISSPTAAGYGDFLDQLHHNEQGYIFYTHLFAAIMQGAQAAPSIIAQLERIANVEELFDVVVIIRGGGAVADLSCFDNYELASNVAQFPLPVIVGIGHERDETVLDAIAHTRVKTPTAAAEFLLSRLDEVALRLETISNAIQTRIGERILAEQARIEAIGERLPLLVENRLGREKSRIEMVSTHVRNRVQSLIEAHKQSLQLQTAAIPQIVGRKLSNAGVHLDFLVKSIRQSIPYRLDLARIRLESLEQIVGLASPEAVIRKGYTLASRNGRTVRSAASLHRGDRINLSFADGEAEALITDIKQRVGTSAKAPDDNQ